MPARSTAGFNQHLTNYGFGIAQDLKKGLSNFLAPEVPTGSSSGQYKKYDSKNAFQVYLTRRAVGGKAQRIEFEASDPYFHAAPNALEITIDDAEREQAGENVSQLEEAKTQTLVSTAVISHEVEVLTKIRAAVSAVGGVGVWSDAAKDPVAEIDAQIDAIATSTGMLPNRLAMSLGVWRVIKNHPKVLGRQPGEGNIGVTHSQFAAMLLNPDIEIRVGVLGRDSARPGNAKNAVSIAGADLFVFFASDSPSVYDPSFAKTFRTRSGGVDQVRMYREDGSRSDVLAVDWSDDIQVVSTELVRRITTS